jgi:putative FmdB family regulatory protein
MPIFEYICKRCNHRFETLVMSTERPKCPRCTSVKLERQVEMFSHGSGGEKVRGLNTDNVIAHQRALIGNIPTIPRYKTSGISSPGRRSRRSTVA